MFLTEQRILEIFRETGAILQGHFLLSSGAHSSTYLQCALVLQFPDYAEQLGSALAGKLGELATGGDFVISPALGGIIIAHETARALSKSTGKKIRAVFVERENGKITLRRGFQIRPGERAIVIEDVVTTGGSTVETIQAAEGHGAKITGAGAIVNRGEKGKDLSVPSCFLLRLQIENYAPANCPLCHKKIPVLKPGSRL